MLTSTRYDLTEVAVEVFSMYTSGRALHFDFDICELTGIARV